MKRRISNDVILAILVISVIGVLLVPIPTMLLDFLLSISVLVGLVTILLVMYIRKPSDLYVFPTLLLGATVFRLALNVSSTRLILLQGPSFDGQLIRAFGDFVVGGNIWIGFIIFLIIVAVQFIVITKGATRIAEVAARFKLDSMPSLFMGVDADLNAGLITQREAVQKRNQIKRDAEFYGAMDGASKFVQGDVKVGLVITLINMVAGVILGLTLHNIPTVAEAFDTFVLLTVGDGLVAQIPSLLVSTAAGIMVTRATSSELSLGDELEEQLGTEPRVFLLSGAFLCAIGLLPGFPHLILFLIGGGLIYLSTRLKTRHEKEEKDQERARGEDKDAPLRVEGLIQVDPILIQIGYSIIPLVDKASGGDLLDRIAGIRKKAAKDLGLIVPPIHIQDNMHFEQNEYAIFLKGSEVARYRVEVDRLLALVGDADIELKGMVTSDPAYGLKAVWIRPEDRYEAEKKELVVVDPSSVIVTHLEKIITDYAGEILTRQDVKRLMDKIGEEHSVVIEEIGKELSVGEIHKVLQRLLSEKVPVRDMVTILEKLADSSRYTKNIDLLCEYARSALSRSIEAGLKKDSEGQIHVFALDAALESAVRDSIKEVGDRLVPGTTPEMAQEIKKAVMEKLPEGGNILVQNPRVRSVFGDLLDGGRGYTVLSPTDISRKAKLVIDGLIRQKKMEMEVKK